MIMARLTFGRFAECEVVDSDFLLGIVDSSVCMSSVVRLGLSCQPISLR